MYKIFYNDRLINLTDDFGKNFANDYGLFYKYFDAKELRELLRLFSYITSIKKLYIFHSDLEELMKYFSSCFTNITAAGGLVTNPEGRILLMKRRGKWDLPKGKAEKGESIQKTALREIAEETGINDLQAEKELLTTYHIYTEGTEIILKKVIWFDVRSGTNGQPVPQTEEDISEVLWMDPRDISMILGNTYLSIIDILKEKKLLPY